MTVSAELQAKSIRASNIDRSTTNNSLKRIYL